MPTEKDRMKFVAEKLQELHDLQGKERTERLRSIFQSQTAEVLKSPDTVLIVSDGKADVIPRSELEVYLKQHNITNVEVVTPKPVSVPSLKEIQDFYDNMNYTPNIARMVPKSGQESRRERRKQERKQRKKR